MNIDLQTLGFTQEELQDRVIDRLCDQLLTSRGFNPETDDDVTFPSSLQRKLDERIKTHINDTINALAEKYILPNVASYIENLTLQQTNQWGEKKGDPITFVEYMVERAQAYMQEKVDWSGKSKSESGNGYGWSGQQTRITHLIHEHLHHSIETAMKAAMKDLTGEVAKGINETAKHKLSEIAANLKVQVTSK